MKSKKNQSSQFVLCLNNEGYAASLEVGKVYRVIQDDAATSHGYVRVIDESGEDYAYTANRFYLIQLPIAIEKALLAAKQVWENLNYHNKNEEYWKNRYRKDYIKSLYVLSHAYYDKIKQDWEESVFALNLRDDVPPDQQIIVDKNDMHNVNQAIEMIQECCKTDCPPELRPPSKTRGKTNNLLKGAFR